VPAAAARTAAPGSRPRRPPAARPPGEARPGPRPAAGPRPGARPPRRRRPGGAQGVHGGRGRGQQLPGQPLPGPQPGQGQGGGQRRPGQQGDPLLGLEPVGEDPPLGQGLGGVGGPAARLQDQPGPDQRRERVGQGDDLAGAAEPPPGHGRDEAVVDPVGQEPAQLGPDPGVAAEQVPQPGHEQGPGLGRGQPRRPGHGPAQEQVALVAGLGRRVEIDRGQPAHAGVDAVHPGPAGQQGGQLGLPGGDPLQGRRVQGQPLAAPGHRLDRLPGQVAGTGQDRHCRPAVGAVWLSEDVDMVAPPACAWTVDT
jgi:translation initiation factor IF-2